jgi:hypothetical protein
MYAVYCVFVALFDRRSQALPTYDAQIAALLAKPCARWFKNEGRGSLYVTTYVEDTDVEMYRRGALTREDFLANLVCKLGHTKNQARHVRDYRKCEKGQSHIWMWYYEVDRRYLAGAFIFIFI